MAESYREKLAKSLRTFLGRWNGGDARLWEFTASLSCLAIRITRQGQQGNLHLICIGVESIRSPVRWTKCAIEVVEVGDAYIVVDKGANCEIRVDKIEVKENVTPVY